MECSLYLYGGATDFQKTVCFQLSTEKEFSSGVPWVHIHLCFLCKLLFFCPINGHSHLFYTDIDTENVYWIVQLVIKKNILYLITFWILYPAPLGGAFRLVSTLSNCSLFGNKHSFGTSYLYIRTDKFWIKTQA